MNEVKNNNSKKLLYYAEKNMMQYTNTKLLSKLNSSLEEDEDSVSKYYVSAYLFFSNFHNDEVKKTKYPKLLELVNDFRSNAFNKMAGKNKYRDALNVVLFDFDNKENSKKTKDELRGYLLSKLKESKMSLHFVANENSLKYSNLYNFLFKNNNNKLSVTNGAKLKLYFEKRLNEEVQ